MCGLVGFFNGCDLKIACPKAVLGKCESLRGKTASAFRRWENSASVRSEPPRVSSIEKFLFPEAFVPILRSSSLREASTETRDALRAAALFQFLNFTHKLELLVVNTVTLNFALGRYDFHLTDQDRLDAHRLYVDEGYHALFSFEAMQGIQQQKSLVAMADTSPEFIVQLKERTDQETNFRRKNIIQLFFVIASEMLITSTLHEAQNFDDMDLALVQMLGDHARDEARHHAFYKNVLLRIWDQISHEDQIFVAGQLPELVAVYCVPDRTGQIADLTMLGFTARHAADIFDETYPAGSTAEYARKVGAWLFRTVRDLGTPLVHDCLDEKLHSLKI